MGLDMYLYARRTAYRSFGDGAVDPLHTDATKVADEHLPPDGGNIGSISVQREVAYWRKANAIHGWFVAHCQNGVDECQASNVPFEKLVELRDTCQKALDEPDFAKAQELIAPTGGFFFGNTDSEEWYRADLKDTVRKLDPLIAWDLAHRDEGPMKEYPVCSYVYRSSW